MRYLVGVIVVGMLTSCAGKSDKKPEKKPEKNNVKAAAEKSDKSSVNAAKPKSSANSPIERKAEVSDSGAARPAETVDFVAVEDIKGDDDVLDLVRKLRETGNAKTLRKKFEGLKHRGSVKTLIQAMRAPTPNIRSQAALILTRMKHRSKEYTRALNAMLLSDPDADVRGLAARTMVFYHDKGTADALIEALDKDKTEGVRKNAAWALGAVGDKKATAVLVKVLTDEATWVRLRAVGALKRLRARKAIRPLVNCLNDKNALVKERAHEALKALTGKKMGPSYKAWRRAYPEK